MGFAYDSQQDDEDDDDDQARYEGYGEHVDDEDYGEETGHLESAVNKMSLNEHKEESKTQQQTGDDDEYSVTTNAPVGKSTH